MEKDYFEYIEDYINGTLGGSLKTEFEEALSKSDTLREQVEFYPLANQLLDMAVAKDLNERINKIKDEDIESKVVSIQKKKPRIFRLVAVAASVLLLLTLGTNWFMSNQYSNQGIASSQFVPYEAGVLLGDNDENDYTKGILAYQKNDFQSAILSFEKVTTNNGLYSESQFYLGNAYLANNEGLKAVVSFNIVLNSNLPQFKEPAEWYKAIALLQLDKEDEAKTLLNQIVSNPNHFYYDKAIATIASLDSFWR